MAKILPIFLLLLKLVSCLDTNLTIKKDFLKSNARFPPLVIFHPNLTKGQVNFENETSSEAPCRGTILFSTCSKKEHCVWLRGACVRRSVLKTPPFTFPEDIEAAKQRFESIWQSSPSLVIPPIHWELALVIVLSYTLVMSIIIVWECIKLMVHIFYLKRRNNIQLSQEIAERENANQSQDTVLIHYPTTETPVSRDDVLQTDEYQVMLVHKSLTSNSLPGDNSTERPNHLFEPPQQQPIPETSNGLAQTNPTVVMLKPNSSENDESSV